MRNDRLFVGLLLVAVGLVLTLQKLGLIPAFSLWGILWQFWPLLLILLGISLILTRGGITTVVIIFLLIILLLGVGLASFFGTDWIWHDHRRGRNEVVIPHRTTRLDIPWDGELEQLSLEVEVAAGRLEIGSGTAKIAEGELPYRANQPQVQYSLQQGKGRLSLKRGDIPSSSTWQVRLTERVPLFLRIDAGAAGARLDLGDLQAERVDVAMGASDLWLRLGTRVSQADVDIDAGASRVVVVVPAGAGVRIRLDSPLSQATLPDYIRQGDDYISPGFAEAATTIDIRLNAGVSSLEVREEEGAGEPSLTEQSM